MPPTLNLIVAMCNNNGIGIQGKLPWKIKGDMAFFRKMTTETKNPAKMNAVIMGRKTWFSIPEKNRPLNKRMNIILSQTMSSVPDGVHLARSFSEALNLISTKPLADIIEGIFVIGGASVYKEALESSYPCRIYLTRVLADVPCDTFMPTFSGFKQIECAEIDNTVQKENDWQYKFEVYEKV